MSSQPARLAGIDALKAIGSQLIVLHHLAFYGPMSDAAHSLAPVLIDWLSDYARIAVQLFLVIGGFLAARSLAPDGVLRTSRPLAALLRRYRKLVAPFAAAIGLAVAAAALARQGMTHSSIPAPPQWGQLLAHLLLLHDVLDIDALSAGVWYVAIDFQLFGLLLLTLWLARQLPAAWRVRAAAAMVAALGLASLFWFNRDADWDMWAIYFFGAYGLGVLGYWASNPGRSGGWLAALAAVGIAALMVDMRSRIALALVVTLWLAVGRRGGWLADWPRGRVFAAFGTISYSVFLVHFPVCLLVNSVMSQVAPGMPWLNAAGMAMAWLASNVAGALFYRYVESRDPFASLGKWLLRDRTSMAG
ncbi:acyltransferase [Cupriavidus gilardii]|uniref:acyltransferase family protein n=1 Tax=Cupriavidus gilardii TaxID=82541 RepID=UPI001ABDC0A4|nr:acyltransferase family protein [Cupriavidus gilardii]MBO4123491.1 acyltransferase [Cupriavidus gilardii]